jgi:hypothetical protein
MLEAFTKSYNHADALMTVALLALIYLAWRSTTVDLAGFGEGVLAIFGGRGAHAWGVAQGQQ